MLSTPVAHHDQTGAFLGFLYYEATRSIFTVPPGWDGSSLQGYPPALQIHIHYTPGWREVLWKFSVLPENTMQ